MFNKTLYLVHSLSNFVIFFFNRERDIDMKGEAPEGRSRVNNHSKKGAR